MDTKETFPPSLAIRLFRIIFGFCAFYFFLMGTGLIFFPHFIIRGFSETEVNPIIIGMIRGAGGSIIPYSLLYILLLINPYKRLWALYIIFLANIIAVILDLGSVMLGEYKMAYAMIDIPIEILSIFGVALIWFKSNANKNQN